MDEANRTREELLLEVEELRRQLSEAQAALKTGEGANSRYPQGTGAEEQGPVGILEAEPSRSQVRPDSYPQVTALPDPSIKILLIEDNPADACLVREMLTDAGADGTTLEWVSTLSRGLEYLTRNNLDLVLLDLSLPDSRGLETFYKAYSRAPEIPFILLTGLDDETLALTAVQKGAQDYLVKGKINGSMLFRAVRYATERKKGEETLRQAHAELERRVEERTAELVNLTGELETGRNLLRSVLEQMPAGVVVAEAPSERIILSNRRAEEIWPPDLLTDLKKFRQMPRFYPDGRPCPEDNFPLSRALTLGETVVDEEYLLQRDAGDHLKVVHLNVNASPVRDEKGSTIAAVATYTDITDQKEAQAALRQSEERYRSLVELSPDAIVVHVKGKIVFANHAAIKLFGASSSNGLLGYPLLDRIHPDYHELSRECIKKIRSGRKIRPQEEKVLRLDGEVVEVEVIGSLIMYQGRSAVQVVFRDITERKQARKALNAANEKLRAMIQASPLAIFLVDREGKIQGVNPAAERIFGWRADELLNRKLPMVPKDKWEEVEDIIRRVWQGEQMIGTEVKHRRQDGRWIDISLSSAPIYDENGHVSGMVTLAQDITARKQAEAALSQSRAQFEAIFNSISDAILFGDQERNIILANPAVKSVFGYKPEELIGQNVEKLYINRTDYELTRKRYFSSGEPAEPELFEISYRRKDGTVFSAESRASMVRDAQGNILGAVGIHRDITARKVADAALKESNRQVMMLADYLQNSSQPFGVGTLDGHIGMFNEAYCQLLGYSQEELSQLNWEKDLTPPEWRELNAVKLDELRRTGVPVRYEKEYLRKDGTRVPVELFVQLRREEEGQPLRYYAFITDITARKEAEAALAESEARFRAVFEGAPIGIAILSFDAKMMKTNPAMVELLGYDRSELEGKNVAEITFTEDIEKDFIKFRELLAGEIGYYDLEKRFIRKDGKIVWGHLAVSMIRGQAEEPLFALGMVEDITARKKAEAALKQERQRLFDLLDAMPAYVSLHAEDYTLRFTNRRFRETFGETEGKSCYEILYTREAPCEGCPLSTVIDNQTFYDGERTSNDGRTLQIYKYPFRDSDGSPCVLTLALDITARKQAETALKESEERFRQLAENIDDTIVLASGDWQRVHYISPAYERIWGRSCASLYEESRSWLEGVVQEDLEKVKNGLRKCMAGDFSKKELPHFRIRRPDGTIRWLAARFFPIRNEAGETYRIAGIATDITERKEIEKVLEWRQEHLGQTAKMEAVGRLAGGVAHDFNNLLTVISGYGELLLEDLKQADQGRQQVKAILKAADQASAVTRQLLAFSRKQVLQPQTLDLNEVISTLVEMFSRLLDENIMISVILAPDLGAVKADPGQMEQVVMNLVINAMDAMPEGGSLVIETANVNVGPDDIRLYPEITPGPYIMVSVADTGVGMTREVLSHIFEPFFTTKERGKGTGLGLSMAYGIIRQSGGSIRVESKAGEGSTFRIYIPRVSESEKPKVSPEPDPDGRADGTILLVEDEEGVRHVVKRMLTLGGYSVLTANDGLEALKIVQDYPGRIYLLLTDVAMPVMGGRELAERLTAMHPEMKVLFMSGHTEDGMVRRGVRESVMDFIQKPFRAEQLLSKVGRLLAKPKP